MLSHGIVNESFACVGLRQCNYGFLRGSSYISTCRRSEPREGTRCRAPENFLHTRTWADVVRFRDEVPGVGRLLPDLDKVVG